MPETAPCPLCGTSVLLDLDHLPPFFPFCSERCKLRDLGRWCDGAYVVPGNELPADD